MTMYEQEQGAKMERRMAVGGWRNFDPCSVLDPELFSATTWT